MSKENPKYWGLDGDEEYYTDDIAERLRDWWDTEFLGYKSEIPEEIEMVGADPVEGPKPEELVDEILDNILTYLDDNYSTAREEYIEPSIIMKLAALEFAEKIVAEYKVYDCERVCRKKVRVRDYLSDSDLEV